jgi:hypothetical protein
MVALRDRVVAVTIPSLRAGGDVKRWLSEPVTRTEAIGWGPFLPTAGFAW